MIETTYKMSSQDFQKIQEATKELRTAVPYLCEMVSEKIAKVLKEYVDSLHVFIDNVSKQDGEVLIVDCEDFRNIHNANCTMYGMEDSLKKVLSSKFVEPVFSYFHVVKESLSDLYEQEEEAYKEREEMLEKYEEEHNIRNTVWSADENPNDNHEFKQTDNLILRNFDGVVPIKGTKTYGDLWCLIDKYTPIGIDHIFIEAFAEKDGRIDVCMGS